jgi:site-specific DNA recombinase
VLRGKVVGKGTWQPLIDEDTHNGLVAFVSQPSRKLATSFEKKYMGSMVYRCGVCDAPMRHALAGNPTRRRYECTNGQHVTRLGEPVDQVVEELLLGRLTSREVQLTLDDGDQVDPAALHAKRAGLQARLDELAGMFAEGEIDGSQLRSGTERLRVQLRSVDAVLADLARRSPTADLLAAGDKIREEWAKLSPDVKGKIIDEVVTIRIMPSPRGYAPFRPELVVPAVWKI